MSLFRAQKSFYISTCLACRGLNGIRFPETMSIKGNIGQSRNSYNLAIKTAT